MPPYRDLPAELTRHSILWLCYAIGAITAVYVCGLFMTPVLFLVASSVPLALISYWVLAMDPDLQVRLPLLWIVTSAGAVGLFISESHPVWAANLLVASAGLVVCAWVGLVLDVFVKDWKSVDVSSRGRPISTVGATLLGIGILLRWFSFAYSDVLRRAAAGRVLVDIAAVWSTVSIVRAVLVGVVVFGILLNAAFLFKEDPYKPPTPGAVFQVDENSLVGLLLSVLRWPTWITIVVLGYSFHYMKLAVSAAADLIEHWIPQLFYCLVSLIGGLMVLVTAHLALLSAGHDIHLHISRVRHLGTSIGDVVSIHLYILAALSLYAVAPLLVGLRLRRSLTGRSFLSEVKTYVRDEGYPSCVSVGRGFSVLGVLLVALPIATIAPGGVRFGLISFLYSLVLTAGVLYFSVAQRSLPNLQVMSGGWYSAFQRWKSG